MITRHQAKYFATELNRKHSVSDSGKIASALVDAQVDLNPHQVDAALFAFKSPLSKGAILAFQSTQTMGSRNEREVLSSLSDLRIKKL